MKRAFRFAAHCLLLLLLGAALLAPAAQADVGPKPSVSIRVVNAPAGELYLDLLTQGAPSTHPYPNSDAQRCDPAALDRLRALEGEGWVLAYTTGVENRPPVFGSVIPDEGGIWRFSYVGLPDTFRIAAATRDEAQVAETSYTRRFTDNIVYDWQSNSVRPATPYPLYFTIQLLSTLIPTLLIEGVVLWLFGFREKRSWTVFLAVNVLTQAGLHLVCGSLLLTSGSHPLFYILTLIFPELIIWIAEAAVFALLIREYAPRRRCGAALCANLASYALGYFPLHLLLPLLERL